MLTTEPYLISPEICKLECSSDGSICGHVGKCCHYKQVENIATRRTLTINKRASAYGLPSIDKEDVKRLIVSSINSGFLCCYCKETLKLQTSKSDFRLAVSIDHIVPMAAGGTNDLSNLQVCCTRCNLVKGTMKESHFKLFLKTLNESGGKEEMLSWLDSAYQHAMAYKIERSKVEGVRD